MAEGQRHDIVGVDSLLISEIIKPSCSLAKKIEYGVINKGGGRVSMRQAQGSDFTMSVWDALNVATKNSIFFS